MEHVSPPDSALHPPGDDAAAPPVADTPREADTPGFRDRYLRRNRTTRLVWRTIVGVVGSAIIVVGIILLPLPGPGWLIIFVGLGVLASEFAWARRVLDFARAKVGLWSSWVTRQSLVVRSLIGAATLAIVAAALLGYLWWQGLPRWLPDRLESALSAWLPFV